MADGRIPRLPLSVASLALALALASISCSSEPRACTAIGCESGLRVQLEPTGGWPEGRYRFEIDADGAHATCTGSIPLPACGTSALACDRTDGFQIIESGCALAPSGQSFPVIRFDAKLRPKTVTIGVLRNDASVGRMQFAPRFETVQPNGEGCEPVCEQASATLQLVF